MQSYILFKSSIHSVSFLSLYFIFAYHIENLRIASFCQAHHKIDLFPEEKDYRVTLYYTVIEIANEFGIQYETDTCGFGAIIACMTFEIYQSKYRRSHTISSWLKKARRK